MSSSPVQTYRPDLQGNDILSPHDYPRTSFLADASTPGYSESEWKAMAAMYSSGNVTTSLFTPSSLASPDRRPMTPKTDSFTHSDVVSKHLLVETALLDSSKFDILAIEEVDSLKKEKQKVDARIESARRKLALESKVRDAAQSLHRLYSTKGRPKQPRRRSILGGGASVPEGERRGSGGSSSNQSETASQAEDELTSSTRKMDELIQILVGLENRRQYIESRLLRHTAAVLQAAHSEREIESSQSLQDSGFDDDNSMPFADGHDSGVYGGRQFHMAGLAISTSDTEANNKSSQRAQDSQLSDVNMRLQLLNGQLRSLISQAKKGRSGSVDSNSPDDIPSAYPEDEEAAYRLNNQLEHMQNSIMTLVQEHKYMKESREGFINDSKHELHALEGRVEAANNQLYNLVSNSPDAQNMYEIRPPPEITGHGASEQFDYLDETLLTVEQMLQQSEHVQDSHNYLSKEMEELRIRSDAQDAKAASYETTVTGLWEIICSNDKHRRSGNVHDNDSDDQEDDYPERVTPKEPFSLQTFSTRVQHLFDRVTHLDLHTETLRRQIQQQRDLAGRAEVDQTLSRELDKAKAREQDAIHELEDHRIRVEELQDQIVELEASLSEHQDDARISQTELQAKEHEHGLRAEELSTSLIAAQTAKDEAEGRLANRESEMAELESQVVLLTTELTMAKAELDGAYGSRTDRAKDVANNPEIQAQLIRLDQLNRHSQSVESELEQLRQEKLAQGNEMQDLMSRNQELQSRSAALETQLQATESRTATLEQELVSIRENQTAGARDDSRMRALEKELADMAADYQELTRETVAVEKERERTEAIVDSLRMHVEGLQVQLGDEKSKWLGVARATTPEPGAREMTSIMVMRTEFKKMMRETRMEAVKALRVSFPLCLYYFKILTVSLFQAEQEERRKLESQIRSLRREKNGGLSPNMAKA